MRRDRRWHRHVYPHLSPLAALHAVSSPDCRFVIVIVSEAAAKLNSDLTKGDDTDDTALVQNHSLPSAEARFAKAHRGLPSVTEIKAHSNRTTECPDCVTP